MKNHLVSLSLTSFKENSPVNSILHVIIAKILLNLLPMMSSYTIYCSAYSANLQACGLRWRVKRIIAILMVRNCPVLMCLTF